MGALVAPPFSRTRCASKSRHPRRRFLPLFATDALRANPTSRMGRACHRANAHSMVASNLASSAELEPLGDVHRAFVLSSSVLHADETPVPMLDPGAGKTKRAYI